MTRIAQQQLESYLWGAAVLLRGTIDAGDYKQFIFPLLFFKRLCDVFDEETVTALRDSDGDKNFALFPENHRFQVPADAHWREIRKVNRDVGRALQQGMRAIEVANQDKLMGIFGDAQWTNKDRLSDAMLRDLIEHFSTLELTVDNLPEDELGQGYEYLIKKFADDSGHTAAEFYTNRTVVHLMTEMLEVQPGESVYDPTCGSGGMLLSCITQLRRPGREWRNVKLYGQERNLMTSSIARMNCFLHGIEDFRIERGDTLAEPKFVEGDRLQRFDVVLANPPYSVKQWNREAFAADPWGRNVYGTPPPGRADYAFWQHILQSLKPKSGRCAILFPHGILFRKEEAEMRSRLIEADAIECILGLGANLFYNSPMEACVVICRTEKPKSRKGKILLINAINEVTRERAQSFLTDDHIAHIAKTYDKFADEPGFARVVTREELRANEGNLSIPLYIAAAATGTQQEAKTTGNFVVSMDDWRASSANVARSLSKVVPAVVAPIRKYKTNPQWAELPLFDRSQWNRVRFGDVVRQIKEQVNPEADCVERYVAGEHMETENVHIRNWGTVGDGYLGPAFIRGFRKGQVLYGSRRTYLKKVAVAEWDGVTANTTFVIEALTGKLLQELLPWLMLSERFTRHSVQESRGSTNPYINFADIAKFAFDLPPLDQQRRIAKILWAVDKARCATVEIQDAGSAAATIILKSKMLGALPDEIGRIRDIGDYRPSDGWKLVKARELVCSPITKGATPTLHLNTPGADVPFLKVYNLTFTGDLDFTVSPTFVERAIHERDLKRSRVRAGDILMNLVGPPLGKVSLVPAHFPEANVNQAIAIYRIADAQLRDFFLEYLQSDLAQRWLQSRSKKTSGQQNLTLELAQELPIPLPPSRQLQEAIECSRSFGQLRKASGAHQDAIQQLISSITNSVFSVS